MRNCTYGLVEANRSSESTGLTSTAAIFFSPTNDIFSHRRASLILTLVTYRLTNIIVTACSTTGKCICWTVPNRRVCWRVETKWCWPIGGRIVGLRTNWRSVVITKSFRALRWWRLTISRMHPLTGRHIKWLTSKVSYTQWYCLNLNHCRVTGRTLFLYQLIVKSMIIRGNSRQQCLPCQLHGASKRTVAENNHQKIVEHKQM